MPWERAARSDDVTGVLRRVVVRGRPVLVGRTAGGVAFAVGPLCPHRNRPMDGGSICGDEIECPHHHYTYDARTGVNRFPRQVCPRILAGQVRDLRTYPTAERDGWVWIRLNRAARFLDAVRHRPADRAHHP
jgi:nitrite reductase/ring-hydroxylating ferredoxin subunit